jgi:GH43 family beta-xylosidase
MMATYQNPLPIKNIGDPFVLRADDGKYYCYATSAADGFKALHNPILFSSVPEISGPGHNSVTTSPNGKELFIVYHSVNGPSYAPQDISLLED